VTIVMLIWLTLFTFFLSFQALNNNYSDLVVISTAYVNIGK